MTKSNTVKYLLYLVVIVILFGAVAAFGPPQYWKKSETPEFCASCHVMAPQYESWFHSGSHKRITCVDCHLPNDNMVEHLVWKGIDGSKDFLYFYGGFVPEHIQSSAHARRVIKSNCERCHQEMVSRINTEKRDCWECHRSSAHQKSGIF